MTHKIRKIIGQGLFFQMTILAAAFGRLRRIHKNLRFLGFFDAAGTEQFSLPFVEVGLEKTDGAVFGVGDFMPPLSAFAARRANHSQYDNIND